MAWPKPPPRPPFSVSNTRGQIHILKVSHQLLLSLTLEKMVKGEGGDKDVRSRSSRCRGLTGQRIALASSPLPFQLSRDEVTTQTSIPAVRIRHDGIPNWPIELNGPR